MNKNIFARFNLLLLFFVLISACAKISAPSGGRRDKLPPVVLSSIPEQGARNFKEKKLIVTFDEYVVLDNMNEKFMVSPPMKKKPRIYIKGKSVITEFEDELKDSTTYTFNYMDGIKDLNEGNFLENYQFVISTGAVIDSLSVTGNVYNSFDLEVPEATIVLLYGELEDSAVIKHLPDYISRVDKSGFFRINNVRSGKFRLYALKDVDNSKNYNLIEEGFAFMDSVIVITPKKNFLPIVVDTTTIKEGEAKAKDTTIVSAEYQLILFEAQKKDHYLTSSDRALKYQLIYTLSLPPSLPFEFSIPETSEDAYFMEESRQKDTVTVWLTDSTLYSQSQITTIVKYAFTDTLGNTGYKKDTIPMRFAKPRATRGKKINVQTFTIDANIQRGSLKPGQQIIINSKTPFSQPDTTHINLYELLDSSRIDISYELIKDSLISSRYFLNANLSPGKKYLFVADSASLGNIFNESIDSTGIQFSIKEKDDYSKLTVKIENCDGDHIIQLLDEQENLIQEARIKNDGDMIFPLIEAGSYRIRAISDLNGDGKWTTGDFISGRQPEPVSYYPGEIEIKKGWEAEQDWKLSPENFKSKKLREKQKK